MEEEGGNGGLLVKERGGSGTSDGIIMTGINKEVKESYMSYAMSVLYGRALPDVRDGLKPVHRRILYGAQPFLRHCLSLL